MGKTRIRYDFTDYDARPPRSYDELTEWLTDHAWPLFSNGTSGIKFVDGEILVKGSSSSLPAPPKKAQPKPRKRSKPRSRRAS